MRIREINPAFFSSSDVIACSVPARLLFVGLWCIADREGRLLDDPMRIKRTLYPDQPIDPNALLEELCPRLIVRYEVDDVACIAIVNFAKYQHVHPREVASKLPPPPESREKARLGGVKPGKGDVKPGGLSGPSDSQDLRVNSPNGESSSSQSRIDVQAVWDAWVKATGRTRSKLDEKRKKLILARLREFRVDDLVAAVRGWKHDPWPDRARQNGIEILLRDAAHVEKFRELELDAKRVVEAPRDSMSDERRVATDAVAAELRRQKEAAEAAL